MEEMLKKLGELEREAAQERQPAKPLAAEPAAEPVAGSVNQAELALVATREEALEV